MAVKRLSANANISFVGDVKAGKFDVAAAVAEKWLSLPANPNGRTNRDVLFPWTIALDVTRRPRHMWIVDFGIDMSESDTSLYEKPFAHVLEHVKPKRDKVNRAKYRDKWWLHAEPVSGMRAAIERLDRFVVTPAVSKYRLFAWQARGTLPDHALIVFGRDDDYFFGVLHSRAHEVWSLRMGTWLGKGNDPRYTPTTCFETFPLPWTPGTEPVDDLRVIAIGNAAANLDRLRRNWLDPEGATEAELKKRTLTNLYNARPTWLQHAHAALDRAVWAAYGWDDPDPATVEEDTILARLLVLILERASTNPA